MGGISFCLWRKGCLVCRVTSKKKKYAKIQQTTWNAIKASSKRAFVSELNWVLRSPWPLFSIITVVQSHGSALAVESITFLSWTNKQPVADDLFFLGSQFAKSICKDGRKEVRKEVSLLFKYIFVCASCGLFQYVIRPLDIYPLPSHKFCSFSATAPSTNTLEVSPNVHPGVVKLGLKLPCVDTNWTTWP